MRCWEWNGERKHGTMKMAMKLVLYGTGAEVDVETGLVLNNLFCVKTNLQVCSRDCPILMRYENLLILILSLL